MLTERLTVVAEEARERRVSSVVPLLSIVLPAHDEAGVVGQTLDRIAAVTRETPGLPGRVEVVVVSDGSRDGTFDEACGRLGALLPGTVIELAANAGSHAAIRCGLRYARGRHIAIMAADGQDPPEALPAMLRAALAGVDVVWGRRADRDADRPGARRAAAAYYRAFRLLTGMDYPPGGLDFLVVSARVVDAVLERSARNTSLFLLIYNLGFAQSFLDYRRGARAGGRSSWSLRKRFGLAVDMLTGCSAAPVRVASLAGLAVAIASVVAGSAALVHAAAAGDALPSWALVLVPGAATQALLLVAVAFLGEYVWRVLDEARGGLPFIESRHVRVASPDAEREAR
jgi:dolichol-phosphate mannosyltransferase